MSEKKWLNSTTLLQTLTFLFFAGLGLFSVYYEFKYYGNMSIAFYLYTIVIILVSIPIHVLLHEVGHLLAGLISGYEFIMFRLFNYLWIKTDKGLSRRKQYIPGVLGQALMVPPDKNGNDRPPFLLYHLGGLLLNSLTAIFFVVFGKSSADPFTRYFFYLSAMTALILLITNLLPFKGTDGYNIRNYLKNPDQEDEIVKILYLYRDMVRGLSFNEIQESITFDEMHDFKNPNTVTFFGLQAAAYLETYDLEKANEKYRILWEHIDLLFEAHKMDVSMNYLFTLLLTDPTHPDVKNIQQSSFYKSYLKIQQVDSFRIFAAEALYLDADYEKALEFLKKAEKEILFAPTVSDERLEQLLYKYLRTILNQKIKQTT